MAARLPSRPLLPSQISACPWCSLSTRPRPAHHRQKTLSRRPTQRSLHSQSRRYAIAAPPIDFTRQPPPPKAESISRNARIVPVSPSYFTGNPDSTDNYLNLQALLRRYQTLPTVGSGQAPRVAWRNVVQYRVLVGEPVRAAKYHKVLRILQRLNKIHPAVMPAGLQDALTRYKRDIDPNAVVRRPAVIDEDGKASGVGRRKTSSAKVYLVPGNGEVLVNGQKINTMFGRVVDRESALWALKATARMDRYNVFALVSGGGTTGQAEAITLGTARALMVFEPALKPALRRGQCTFRSIHLCSSCLPFRLTKFCSDSLANP